MSIVASPGTAERRETLLQRLPRPETLVQGSLVRYRFTCRAKGCHCHKGYKHGPYWYLSVKRQGKTKMYLIPDDRVLEIRRGIKEWKRHALLIQKIVEANIEIIRGKEARHVRPRRSSKRVR